MVTHLRRQRLLALPIVLFAACSNPNPCPSADCVAQNSSPNLPTSAEETTESVSALPTSDGTLASSGAEASSSSESHATTSRPESNSTNAPSSDQGVQSPASGSTATSGSETEKPFTSGEADITSSSSDPVPALAQLGASCLVEADCASDNCQVGPSGKICCATSCGANATCSADGLGCRECDSGATRCANGAPQACSSEGIWTAREPCSGETPVCIETTGQCGSCEQGDRQCASSTEFEVCNAQGQFQAKSCASTTPACLNGTCVECSPESVQCVGSTPQVCSPTGTWVTQAPCSGNTPICDRETGGCRCEEGSFDCEGQKLLACTDGEWKEAATCTGELPVCDESSGKCECDSGARECRTGYAARFECVDGEWNAVQCAAPNDVCVDGACVECDPESQPTCDGNVRVSCSAQGAEVHEACALVCDEGECRDTRMEAGAYLCDLDTALICESGNECCRNDAGISCIDAEQSCDGTPSTAIACDDHSDCSGVQKCCLSSYSGKSGLLCRDKCSGMGFLGWVCDATHPCDSSQACSGEFSLNEVTYCKAQ